MSYEEELNKAKEDAERKKTERLKALLETQELRLQFESRYDSLLDKLWQIIIEVSTIAGLKYFRHTTIGGGNLAYDHLSVYDPEEMEGPGIMVPVKKKEHRLQVAGVTLGRMQNDEPGFIKFGESRREKLLDVDVAKMEEEKLLELLKLQLQDRVVNYIRNKI